MDSLAEAANSAVPSGVVVVLDHFAVIAIEGDDARSFLNGQLTNDVLSLDLLRAQLNGYCSPKGRLLATFLNWTDGSSLYLMLPRALCASVQKRLSMYVLRAKAKLRVAELTLWGLAGAEASAPITVLFGATPDTVWQRLQGEAGSVIRIADACGAPRWIVVSQEQQAATALAALVPQSIEYWRWLDIRAGLPWILAATQDKFVPQMVNFEALGGVSFKKGCYPGQEIVARSQYLGKLKRRTALAHVDAGQAIEAGNDINDDNGQPVGIVVNAEIAPRGGIDLLVELPVAQIGLALSTTDGRALQCLPLPYELPDNEVFVRPKL